ncbi:hypothetical protein [Catenulispora yoronensis]
MGWLEDSEHEQDGVYGLELVSEAGEEPEATTGRGTGFGTSTGGTGVERRETIGSDQARRLPRALRVVGILAVGAALTVTLWPASGPRAAKPAPADIRVAGTSLVPAGRVTTLTLVLANDTPSSASIGEAVLQDADGRRIGSNRRWPAGEIASGSTLAINIPVPYYCDTHISQRLPIALHVSVSSPLDPGRSRTLSYPLDAQVWQQFTNYQAGVCDATSAIGLMTGQVSVVGTNPGTRSVKVVTPVWTDVPLTVDGLFSANPALWTTDDPQPPLVLPAGGWQPLVTDWHVSDCGAMSGQWDKAQSVVLAYEGPTGGTSLVIPLPAGVVAQLSATACPP